MGIFSLVYSLLEGQIYEKVKGFLLYLLQEMCDLHAAARGVPQSVCEASIDEMSDKRESVLIQLREGARQSIQSNRKKLCSIIDNCLVLVTRILLFMVIVTVVQT